MRFRRIAAVLALVVSVGSLGGATPAAAAQVRTCETTAGRYEVTPPPPGPDTGADPAAIAAADCAIGFDEQTIYPLSVIALCLLATAVTLVLVRKETSHDGLAVGMRSRA